LKRKLLTKTALILVCALALGACGFGIRGARIEKQKRAAQAAQTEARAKALSEALSILQAGRTAYLADAASVQDGKNAYDTQKDLVRIAKEAIDKRRAALAKAQAAGTLQGADLDEARSELDMLTADLASKNEALSSYEKLKAKVGAYEKEKTQARALLENLKEDDRIRKKIEAGEGPIAAARAALEEEAAAIKRRFYITVAVFSTLGGAAVVVLCKALKKSSDS